MTKPLPRRNDNRIEVWYEVDGDDWDIGLAINLCPRSPNSLPLEEIRSKLPESVTIVGDGNQNYRIVPVNRGTMTRLGLQQVFIDFYNRHYESTWRLRHD